MPIIFKVWERGELNFLSFSFNFPAFCFRGIQTAAEAIDSNGNLFFGLMDPLAIACWDSSTPFSKDNIRIVMQNNETLQFASGMKVIESSLGQEDLWIVTNRLQVKLN